MIIIDSIINLTYQKKTKLFRLQKFNLFNSDYIESRIQLMIEKANSIGGLSESPRQSSFQPRNRLLHPINRNNSGPRLVQLNFIDYQHTTKGCQNQGYSLNVKSSQRRQKSASNSRTTKKPYFKERFSVLIKNGLHSYKSNQSLKKNGSTRELQPPKNEIFTLMNEQKGSIQPKSNNSIHIKRMTLQKRGQYVLRIQKQNIVKAQRQSKKSDVSFQEGLKTPDIEEQKLPIKGEIFSENLLESGLRKKSKPKLKALVTNPFDKAIKQDALSQIAKQLQKQKFEESRIETHMQESSVSVAQVKQFDELLQMLGN